MDVEMSDARLSELATLDERTAIGTLRDGELRKLVAGYRAWLFVRARHGAFKAAIVSLVDVLAAVGERVDR